jgi:putative intracellular protease/amidase
MPLPGRDFDPTESAVSWLMLTNAGHRVAFATPHGRPGIPDEIMLTGRGLPLAGPLLRANRLAREAWSRMEQSPEFRHPRHWEDLNYASCDGLLLPGGHRARGMREYLESPQLQRMTLDFFLADKPVAAVCHGVLLAARTINPATGRSILHGRKTTSLTWAMERKAAALGRVVRFWDPGYYRTYQDKPGQPVGYMSVQREVTRALANPADFLDVPATSPHHRMQTDGLHRDSPEDSSPAFVCRDGNYLSARWPGDVFTFGRTFAAMLSGGAV